MAFRGVEGGVLRERQGENENPSPLRKTAKMGEEGRKKQRAPLSQIFVNQGPSRGNHHNGPKQKGDKKQDTFAVFSEETEEENKKVRPERQRLPSVNRSIDSGIHTQSTIDCLSQRASTSADTEFKELNNPVLGAVPRLGGRHALLEDPKRSSQSLFDVSLTNQEEEESGSPEDEEGDECADSPMAIEEGNSSVYESAFSSSVASSYHTAPLGSAREAHGDIIYSVTEYSEDIFEYLMSREVELKPSPNYIKKQSEVNQHMRGILVDWLVDVGEEYTLEQETLHLAVRYVDLFLSKTDVPRKKLQLIGTTSMMIAAKYEEIWPPDANEFVYVTDDTYTKQQVLKMETLILKGLNFDVSVPTAVYFAKRYWKLCKADRRTQCLISYLLDLSMLTYAMLVHRPSKIAAAAVCLANLMCDAPLPWPRGLEILSEYTVYDLSPLINEFVQVMHSAPTLSEHAIYDKYSQNKFVEVALITPPDSFPEIVPVV